MLFLNRDSQILSISMLYVLDVASHKNTLMEGWKDSNKKVDLVFTCNNLEQQSYQQIFVNFGKY